MVHAIMKYFGIMSWDGLTTGDEMGCNTEAYKVIFIDMSFVCPHNPLVDVPELQFAICGPVLAERNLISLALIGVSLWR